MLIGTGHSAIVFTQSQFDEYARISGDDNPIYVDADFAAGTRFGRTVAHGMLLFSSLQAALARRWDGPLRLRSQELVFLAPTFTGDPLLLGFDSDDGTTINESITDSAGIETTVAIATLGPPDEAPPAGINIVASDPYRGLAAGMMASRTRRFTADDVAEFVHLTRDPNPLFAGSAPEVPPGLLAGMETWVLGVDLPGRGTNWLEQRFAYHHPVPVPADVTCTVTITRVRSEKGLINLATRSVVDDRTVVSGQALVLATDTADRPLGPS